MPPIFSNVLPLCHWAVTGHSVRPSLSKERKVIGSCSASPWDLSARGERAEGQVVTSNRHSLLAVACARQVSQSSKCKVARRDFPMLGKVKDNLCVFECNNQKSTSGVANYLK